MKTGEKASCRNQEDCPNWEWGKFCFALAFLILFYDIHFAPRKFFIVQGYTHHYRVLQLLDLLIVHVLFCTWWIFHNLIWYLLLQAATRILARQLVRLRQQITNLQGSRAQIRGIATHTQVKKFWATWVMEMLLLGFGLECGKLIFNLFRQCMQAPQFPQGWKAQARQWLLWTRWWKF